MEPLIHSAEHATVLLFQYMLNGCKYESGDLAISIRQMKIKGCSELTWITLCP